MIITGMMSALLVFASIAARSTGSILVIGGKEIPTFRFVRPVLMLFLVVLYGFSSGNVLSLQGACVPPLLVH